MLDDVALNIATAPAKKYYVMKILKNINSRGEAGDFGPKFILSLKWGKMGDRESTVVHWEEFSNAGDAEKAFKVKFSEKSFNDWDDRENYSHVDGGYRLVTEAEVEGGISSIFQRIRQTRNQESGQMELENLDKTILDKKHRERAEWKEKLNSLDQKVQFEISNLNFEVAHVMRSLFSLTEADRYISELGIDRNELDLANLSVVNINNAHLILSDIQSELQNKNKKFNRIFELSSNFAKLVPLLSKKKTISLIDDIEKIRARFRILEGLRSIMTICEIYKGLHLERGSEKNPIDLIHQELPTKFMRILNTSEEFQVVEKMLGVMGTTHTNFSLELIDVFNLANQT